jgi:hypothetical protein
MVASITRIEALKISGFHGGDWLVTAKVVHSSLILVTQMMEVLHSSETSVLTRAHGITSQKIAFFIITAVQKFKSYIELTG